MVGDDMVGLPSRVQCMLLLWLLLCHERHQALNMNTFVCLCCKGMSSQARPSYEMYLADVWDYLSVGFMSGEG